MKKLFLILILYKLGNLSSQNLCNGNLGAPIENTNFGTGAIGTHTTLPAAAGATTTYTHVTAAPGAAEYVISASFNGNAAWHIATDRTNANTGRTMVINANTGAGIFYTKTIPGLLPNTNYEFGAYVANLLRNTYVGATVVQPNIRFTVYNLTKTVTIATVNTGTIASTANLVWNKYGTTFNSGTNTSVVLEISNVQAGTNGNDFALDDITLAPCIPNFEEIETCISDNQLLLSSNNITWNSNSNISYSGSNSYFNTSTSGEGIFEVISSSKAYRITVVSCCEDPCSWSKTGNDNINSGHFLGTRNNADLNFKTNNELKFKIGNSNVVPFEAYNNGSQFAGITGILSTKTNGSGTQLGPKLSFHKSWGAVWSMGIDDNTDHSFNIYEDAWNNNANAKGNFRIKVQKGNTKSKVIIPDAGGGFRPNNAWPSGWGGGLATWDILCASIQGIGFINLSDERLKTNITNLKSNGLEIISKLNPVFYNWKDPNFPKRKVYGFLAQQVQKVLPEIVETADDEAKTLSMNYIDLIPISIQAIKELNTKVEKQNNAVVENEELKAKIAVMEEKFTLLEKTITQLCESGCAGLEKKADADVLFQSIPNPTDSEALINYHLIREYRDASISVSSQDGKQLMSVKLEAKKGAGSIKINLGDLANGTYLYTLVAGERVIDTKKLQIIK